MKALTIIFCILLTFMLFASTGLLMYLIAIPATIVTMKLMVVSLIGIALPLTIMLCTA